MVKKIINAIKRFFGECYYGIGFIDNYDVVNSTPNKPKVRWIKGVPRDRWYADPFILDVKDDVVELLVEMYKYKEAKGVLCRLEIDRATNRLIKESIILTLPTHLSFPFIHEEDNKIYVIPENYQSGTLSIYEYDRQRDLLINPRVLLEEPLLDTVCNKINGYYYLFTTKYSCDVQARHSVLYIYKSNELFGEYELIQTTRYDEAEARGAGAIIEMNGMYIRPSQDCNGGYGKCVIFSKLEVVDEEVHLQECNRLKPIGCKFSEGLHTYNQKQGLAVIDGYRYRRGLFSKLLGTIYNKFRRC